MIYYLIPIETGDFYSSPESNLFIILAHFAYVKLLTPENFLTKLSHRQISDGTIFLSDNQLQFYRQLSQQFSIYVLAVQKKQIELDLLTLRQVIRAESLIFQSKFQQKSYQNWYNLAQLDQNWMQLVKVLPIYGLTWEKKWQFHQTLYSSLSLGNNGHRKSQQKLLIFDSINPLSIHLMEEFEKIGYLCVELSQVKAVAELQKTIKNSYLFFYTSKLVDFPYQILLFLQEGVPCLTVDYLYSLIDSSYSYQEVIGEAGLVMRRELWSEIRLQVKQIETNYRKYQQQAKLLADQLNGEYQTIYQQLFPAAELSAEKNELASEQKKIGLKIGGSLQRTLNV